MSDNVAAAPTPTPAEEDLDLTMPDDPSAVEPTLLDHLNFGASVDGSSPISNASREDSGSKKPPPFRFDSKVCEFLLLFGGQQALPQTLRVVGHPIHPYLRYRGQVIFLGLLVRKNENVIRRGGGRVLGGGSVAERRGGAVGIRPAVVTRNGPRGRDRHNHAGRGRDE